MLSEGNGRSCAIDKSDLLSGQGGGEPGRFTEAC